MHSDSHVGDSPGFTLSINTPQNIWIETIQPMNKPQRLHVPFLCLITFFTGALQSTVPAESEFPGTKTLFHGFTMFHDTVSGERIVVPTTTAAGTPWVWRARFWGHKPQFDLAMVNRGYHLAFCDVGNLFGNEEAIHIGSRFYKKLVTQHDFSPRPVLEGMSRGGLFVYNWALANPDSVTAIYADAPVMDFRSWPGGTRAGKQGRGSNVWETCLKAYSLSHNEAVTYSNGPLNRLHILAKENIPIIHVIGQEDTVVPPSENTNIAEMQYTKLSGTIRVIRKPGVGHHPHSLADPAPLVEFIERAWKAAETKPHRLTP